MHLNSRRHFLPRPQGPSARAGWDPTSTDNDDIDSTESTLHRSRSPEEDDLFGRRPSKRARLHDIEQSEESFQATSTRKAHRSGSNSDNTHEKSGKRGKTDLIKDINELIDAAEKKYQTDGHPKQELVLAFSRQWTFRERKGIHGRGLASEAIPLDEKDSLLQLFFNQCIRSVEDPRFKKIKAERCGIQLELAVEQHRSIVDKEMTQDTGLSIPIGVYQEMMTLFEKLCTERLKELHKNGWKNYTHTTACPDSKIRERYYYLPEYKWLETATVHQMKPIRAGRSPFEGQSPEELGALIKENVSLYTNPSDVSYLLKLLLEAVLDTGENLPSWKEEEVRTAHQDNVVRQAISEENFDPVTRARYENSNNLRVMLYNKKRQQQPEDFDAQLDLLINQARESHQNVFSQVRQSLFTEALTQISNAATRFGHVAWCPVDDRKSDDNDLDGEETLFSGAKEGEPSRLSNQQDGRSLATADTDEAWAINHMNGIDKQNISGLQSSLRMILPQQPTGAHNSGEKNQQATLAHKMAGQGKQPQPSVALSEDTEHDAELRNMFVARS